MSFNEVATKASANTLETFGDGMTLQSCFKVGGAGLTIIPLHSSGCEPGKGHKLGYQGSTPLFKASQGEAKTV